MRRSIRFLIAAAMLLSLAACGSEPSEPEDTGAGTESNAPITSEPGETPEPIEVPEDFLLIHGGTFDMGSPDDEPWRSDDETQHTVTVSEFYMSAYEVTQQEYASVMGENPSNFSGDTLEESVVIKVLRSFGYGIRAIARMIGCAPATVVNELRRGTPPRKSERGAARLLAKARTGGLQGQQSGLPPTKESGALHPVHPLGEPAGMRTQVVPGRLLRLRKTPPPV